MKINSITTTPTTTQPLAFGAVRFQPQNLNKWNQEVLAATLESKFVKHLIRRNENISKVDTILRYSDSPVEIFRKTCEQMSLSVLSGSSEDLYVSALCSPGTDVSDKIKFLTKDLVDKIKKQDKIFGIQKNLDKIKKLAANVIYTIE